MKLFLSLCLYCAFLQQAKAQSTPLIRSTFGISGSSETISTENNTYIIQQSLGQTSAIGTFNSNDYILRQGFIQPNVLAMIIDENIPINLQVTIYPNPFKKNISLSFNEEIENEVSLAVFDMAGRSLLTKHYKANQQMVIPLGFLPSGAFIIKIIANHKQFIGKIIKE